MSLQVKPVTSITGRYLLKHRSGDTVVFLNLTCVKVRRVPKSSNLYYIKAFALSAGLKNFHSPVKMNLLTLYGELFKVITDR